MRIARDFLLLVGCVAFALHARFGAAVSPAISQVEAQTGSLHLPPLGLRIRDMSAKERDDLKLTYGVAVVVAVGASAIAGVREDDIILAVDKKSVTGPEQFWLLMDAAKWKCTLKILRKDKRIEIVIGAENK